MIVLGIDPGTLHLGWGVIRSVGTKLTPLGYGVIDAPQKEALADRLVRLEHGLKEVIARFSPEAGSVESLFFHKDPQAAAKLGHARGIVLLCLARAQLPIFEYPPARVKLTVAGSGRADKGQITRMVTTLLALPEAPREDAADALALALTYIRRARVEDALARATARIPKAARPVSLPAAPKGSAAKRRTVRGRSPAR